MKNRFIHDNLMKLYQSAPSLEISNQDDIVIFSDLHMGNGTIRDDFQKNSALFQNILEHYYLQRNFKLFLNGDIEELQKFSLKKITKRWHEIYRIFSEFEKKKNLFRIIGNHDSDILHSNGSMTADNVLPAIKLCYNGYSLFIFHGHQASAYLEKYNELTGLVLKYIAKPLHIKNKTTAYNSKRKFKIEKQVYRFATDNKIVSIIGHTHRPLFESLSKIDYLKYKIERLCRNYQSASGNEKKIIENYIKYFRQELLYSVRKNKYLGFSRSLYNSNLVVPCLFNSGCAIGKRGITALEICNKKISLVHWFDKYKNKKYAAYQNGHPAEQFGRSHYYRTILKDDPLDYIFTRIKLLT